MKFSNIFVAASFAVSANAAAIAPSFSSSTLHVSKNEARFAGTFPPVENPVLQQQSSKRDLLGNLEKIPVQLLTEAIDLVAKGAITGFDDLLSYLGINATTANKLGLSVTESAFELIGSLGELIATEIEKDLGEKSKRSLASELEGISVKLLTKAITALTKGLITKGVAGFEHLLEILGISEATANKIGLKVTQDVPEWIKLLAKFIVEKAAAHIFKRDGVAAAAAVAGVPVPQVIIPIEFLNNAIQALLKGTVDGSAQGFINLLNILHINATAAAELGLTEGQSTVDLVIELGHLISVEAAAGVHYFDKRDFLGDIEQIPIHLLTEAIDDIVSGVIKPTVEGYDELLGLLGINATIANELGIILGEDAYDLVASLGKIIEDEVEKEWKNLTSKRDLVSDLVHIPITLLNQAIEGLLNGTITTADELISFLDLSVATAGELGIVGGETVLQLVAQIAKLIATEIEHGLGSLKKRDLVSDLVHIPITLLNQAIEGLLNGTITTADELISFLDLSVATAGELGIVGGETVLQLVAQIAKLIATEIEHGLGSLKKRDLASDLESVSITLLTNAIEALTKGLITSGVKGFETLLGILGISAATANRLGLEATQTVAQWIKQLAQLIIEKTAQALF
ncbi:uncharacterized protein LODBEIA_P52780 [Lodderomyces beijingensis]|uniref:Uncharacterized protein n=1 Tax=Lodderomyces beijingensis TaxID=1775926 RepID=A0ABP0ZSD3_9ASCO